MRRKNDFYPTPSRATEILLEEVPQLLYPSWVLEPCAGDGDISKVITTFDTHVVTADIDPDRNPDYVRDARILDPYTLKPIMKDRRCSVITNPPFIVAFPIIKNFVERCLPSAFLLRLSFLEPTETRGDWLEENPPDKMIVLPRISFTGDGKTDSVTCAWMCWNVEAEPIQIISKKRFRGE